jgi:hypothetical protein
MLQYFWDQYFLINSFLASFFHIGGGQPAPQPWRPAAGGAPGGGSGHSVGGDIGRQGMEESGG